MKTKKMQTLMAAFVVATAGFLGACASVGDSDQWFVLGEQTLQSVNPSVEIKSEGGRWDKDVKQVKLSAEGADIQITNLVLHWDNRPDDTIPAPGVLKSGGQTAPYNAPGLKGRLTSVTVQYQILGGASSSQLKVWGYD
jgi:hypothetical protein